jgi:hypothetical protein
MRKFLFVLVAAIFLCSPLGPSWGQFAVNAAIVACLFSFFGKHAVTRRRYE